MMSEKKNDRSRTVVGTYRCSVRALLGLAVFWIAGFMVNVGLTAEGDDGKDSPAVHAAYVLLGPPAEGAGVMASARVIVDADRENCPELTGASSPIPMSFRRNPHGFPVRVCEAVIPLEQALRVSWQDIALPAVILNPSRILVLGDSGCKEDDCPGESPATPFDKLVTAATRLDPPPDLILHVGDYNYRGTAGSVPVKGSSEKLAVYDAGDDAPDDPNCQLESPYVSQNAGYSASRDNWEAWKHDFFEPAKKLLSRAPWVFARGNHELCSRAGPGWFYFLDASAEPHAGGSGQLECPFQGGDTPPGGDVTQYLQFVGPRHVDLGTLRIAVIDSANACDGFAPEETTSIYTGQLAEVLRELPQGKTTWVLTHRPFWGATEKKDAAAHMPGDALPVYRSISRTLQRAVTQALAGAEPPTLPASPKLLVSGHMHTFQSVTFFDDGTPPRPPQLVVGNSGVALEGSATDKTFDATVGGVAAHVTGVNEHGMLDISKFRPDGDWSGQLLDPKSEIIAQCDTQKLPESLCTRCDASQNIRELLLDPQTPEKALGPLAKALGKADEACAATDFLVGARRLRKAVALLLRAGRRGAGTGSVVEDIVVRVRSRTAAKIAEAVRQAGTGDKHVKKAREKFALASEKENPKREVALLRQSYARASKAISGAP